MQSWIILLVIGLLSLRAAAQLPGAPGLSLCQWGVNTNSAVLCITPGSNTYWYNISIQLDQLGQSPQLVQSMNPQTYFYFYNLNVGQPYTIIVNAINNQGYTQSTLDFSTQSTYLITDILSTSEIVLGWYSSPNDASYTITKRPNGSGQPFTLLTTTTNTYYYDYSVVAGGLYDYQLAVTSQDGFTGALSPIYTQSALPVPTAPIAVLSSTSISLFLSWANVQSSLNGVAYYRVYYRQSGGSSFTQFGVTLPDTTQSVNVTGLSPSTSYDLQLACGTVVNDFSNSNIFTVTTLAVNTADVIPSPPSSLSFNSGTLTSMQFSWSSVSNALYYILSCAPNYSGYSSLVTNLTTSFTQDIIPSLSPSTDYVCVIYSGNNAGVGPASSSSVVGRTSIAVAQNFASSSTTFTGASFTWSAFPTPNDISVYYLSYFAPPYTSQTGFISINDVTATSATISDGTLTSGVTYQAYLQTQNPSGASFTPRITFTTNVQSCSNPSSFTQSTTAWGYSATNITLTWIASTGASGYLLSIPNLGLTATVTVGTSQSYTFIFPQADTTSTSGISTAYITAIDSAGAPCSSAVAASVYAYPLIMMSNNYVSTWGQYAQAFYISNNPINIVTAVQLIYYDPVVGVISTGPTSVGQYYMFKVTNLKPSTLYNFSFYMTYGSYGTNPVASMVQLQTVGSLPPPPSNATLVANSAGYILSWSCVLCDENNTMFGVAYEIVNSTYGNDVGAGGTGYMLLFYNNTQNVNVPGTFVRGGASTLPQPYGIDSWAVQIYANKSQTNSFVVYTFNDAATQSSNPLLSHQVSNAVPPTVSSFTSSNNSVTLAWVPATTGPVDIQTVVSTPSYIVSCRTPVRGSTIPFSTNTNFTSGIISGTTYTFNSSLIEYGTDYECQIQSYYNNGNLLFPLISPPYTPFSSLVTVTVPPVLTIRYPTSTSINISWPFVQGASSFSLYERSPAGSGSFVAYATNIHQGFFVASNIPTGLTFDCYVTAYNSAGQGVSSQIYYNNIVV